MIAQAELKATKCDLALRRVDTDVVWLLRRVTGVGRDVAERLERSKDRGEIGAESIESSGATIGGGDGVF